MAEPGVTGGACWFCRRGRHEECMKTVPVTAGTPGSHECSFDSADSPCTCGCS